MLNSEAELNHLKFAGHSPCRREDQRFFRIKASIIGHGKSKHTNESSKICGRGSTIEQQLIRTYTGDKRRTIRRKLKDMIMASMLASSMSKGDIARLYIYSAYYGWRANGILQACHRFGVRLDEHSLTDACSIVARLKYPEPQHCSPERERKIQRRTMYILERIHNDGRIRDLVYTERWSINDISVPSEVMKRLTSVLTPEDALEVIFEASSREREWLTRLWISEGIPMRFENSRLCLRLAGFGWEQN